MDVLVGVGGMGVKVLVGGGGSGLRVAADVGGVNVGALVGLLVRVAVGVGRAVRVAATAIATFRLSAVIVAAWSGVKRVDVEVFSTVSVVCSCVSVATASTGG